MKITKKDLARHAEKLLETLRGGGISSLELALNAVGKKFETNDQVHSYVHIITSPSNQGTIALKVSYIRPNFESVPLELVFNQKLRYRQLIFKCCESVAGYVPFGIDGYGNLQHFKKTDGCEWDGSIREVEALSELG